MNENETGVSPPSPVYKLSCTDVPQELLLRSAAKHYFSQFGRLHRLTIRPKSRICLVEYATEKGMQLALARAGEFSGRRFPVTKVLKQAVRKKREKKEEDPDWAQDPEVQEELKAMEEEEGELQKDYGLRSNDMQVDEIPTTPKTKLPKQRFKKSLLTNITAGTIKPKKVVKKSWKSATASERNLPMEQLELIKTIKQSAMTVEEKYKILEARDKLIRLRTKKYTDLAKAKVTVGTCPDMCPEKERLMRETQHQISLYEQETGGKGMNPSLAVKQYSRSSADQEVPLPHELRPVRVLRMTMMYLMARIMNLCDTIDVNFGDWYHFLWDRTRGIRKDITQQELCSEEAVELVEQCARFHIHCSARLVGEDPSVFDQKINTENLTKCLQTLKYMYHDLELKGVCCRNEAEFRAYIILLNLNDGNFMWEVQQLRQDVQKSEEVRFALQVYSALDKNNYVRFFKLVHSTTYLNACLLLRYFVQVRLCALKTILKCFSPRQPHKSYPLGELTDILAFESVESTVDFLEYHGLMLTEDRTQVILDRRLFGMPEYPYAIDRAIRVIESKRVCSVGEIISGGRLIAALYENHRPQDSFDATGRLNVTEILTELNISLEDDLVEEIDMVDTVPNAEIRPIFGTPAERSQSPLFVEVVPPAKLSVDTAGIHKSPSFGKPLERSHSPLFGEVAPSTKLSANTAGIHKSPSFGKPLERSRSPLFVEVAPSTKLSANTAGIHKSPSFGKPLERTRSPLFIDSKPTPPSTTGMFAAASGSIFSKEKTARSTTFERFKFVVPEEKPAKPTIVPFQSEPPTPPSFSQTPKPVVVVAPPPKPVLKPPTPPQPKPDLTALAEERKAAAAELKEKQLREQQRQEKQRREVEKRRLAEIEAAVAVTVTHILDCVDEQVRHAKLQEIARKVGERKAGRCFKVWRETVRMRRRKRKAVDYCFAWLMPRTAQEEADELKTPSQSLVLSDMKRYKSGKSVEITIPRPLTVNKINLHEVCYTPLLAALTKMSIPFPKELFFKVAISLNSKEKHVEEILNDCIGWKNNNGATFILQQNKTVNQNITYCIEKQNNCQTDANAVIVIANCVNHNLLQTTTRPFVLLLPNQPTPGITQQFERQIISGRFTTENLPQLIEKALKFLAQNLDKSPPLELDTLKSFLTLHFAGDIWKRIGGLAKWNSSYRDCLKRPEIAIKIYNDNLDKLSDIIFDAQRKDFPEFPPVFTDYLRSTLPEYLPCDYKYFPKFWKSKNYERALKNRIDTLYLSDYVASWPPANESVLEADLFAYCEKNFKTPEKAFYKIMSVVLRNINPESDFDAIKNFLWTDLMETIALEKMAEVDFAFCDAQSVFNQLFVVYNADVLKKLVVSSWFYVNYPPIRSKIKELMVKSQAEVQPKKRKSSERFSLELDMDLDEMLDKVTRNIVDQQERDLKMRKDVEEIKSLMSDLKESMKIQKKINSTFQKFALENV